MVHLHSKGREGGPSSSFGLSSSLALGKEGKPWPAQEVRRELEGAESQEREAKEEAQVHAASLRSKLDRSKEELDEATANLRQERDELKVRPLSPSALAPFLFFRMRLIAIEG